MALTPVTPTDISPAGIGSWQDADLSTLIPAGSTGVVIRIINTAASTANAAGVRKNGSTDDHRPARRADSMSYWFIGVDGSRIVELYRGHADVVFDLVGAFDSMAVFRTNALDISTNTTDTWVTTSIASEVGSDLGLAAMLQWRLSSSLAATGARKPGSIDDRTGWMRRDGAFDIVPLSASKEFEQFVGSTSADLFLIGWINRDAVFHANAPDRGPNVTSAWTNLTALPEGAIAAIYDVTGSAGSATEWGIRKDGSAEDIKDRERMAGGHAFAFAESASQIVEAWTGSTSLDFYELGYFTESVAGAELSVTDYAQTPRFRDEDMDMEFVQSEALFDVVRVPSLEIPVISAVPIQLWRWAHFDVSPPRRIQVFVDSDTPDVGPPPIQRVAAQADKRKRYPVTPSLKPQTVTPEPKPSWRPPPRPVRTRTEHTVTVIHHFVPVPPQHEPIAMPPPRGPAPTGYVPPPQAPNPESEQRQQNIAKTAERLRKALRPEGK